MRRSAVPILAVLLVAEAAFVALAVAKTYDQHQVLIFESLAVVMFAAAVSCLAAARWTGTATRRAILAVSALFTVLAVRRPPVDSDDAFRYLWDGKVQLAGIDPYRYAPSAPQLASLREEYLFPSGTCAHYPLADGSCTQINLPNVHTIYPPVAEAAFALLRILSFGQLHLLPLQLAGAAAVVAIGWLISRGGRPLWQVALWAWCPVPIIEFANNAHIDWLAVLLTVGALLAAAKGRSLLAGVLIGAAVATKLYPALAGAAMLRRRPLVVIGSAAGLVALSYLPHLFAVGGGVIGYLPTYLNQGGYGNGNQYRLLRLILPEVLCTPVAVLLVVGAAAWALRSADPRRPERAALLIVGTAVLVATPSLPWYTCLLLALAAMNGRPEWLGVVVAPTIQYLLVGSERFDIDNAITTCYAAGLLILIAGTVVRLRLAPTHTGSFLPGNERNRLCARYEHIGTRRKDIEK